MSLINTAAKVACASALVLGVLLVIAPLASAATGTWTTSSGSGSTSGSSSGSASSWTTSGGSGSTSGTSGTKATSWTVSGGSGSGSTSGTSGTKATSWTVSGGSGQSTCCSTSGSSNTSGTKATSWTVSGGSGQSTCCSTNTTSTSKPKATSWTVTGGSGQSTCCTVTTSQTTTSWGGGGSWGGGCTSNCGGGGGGGGCTHNCTPPQKPAPTCTIHVNKNSITSGEPVVVSWSTSNAVQGDISNIGTNVPLNYSLTVYPTQTTTYTGTFHNGQGKSVTCSASVGVLPPPTCPAGYTGTYPNCVPPVVHPAPSCNITIVNYQNNGYFAPNQPVTISWSSNHAQYGHLSHGMGTINLNGTRVVYPTQTTTYTATFTGYNNQTINCSVTVNINNYVPPVYPQTPYVTLSQVPYTGLELGPVGTFLYWAFIVVWCLLAAYLIAVKKVQNQVYGSLKSLLFGTHAQVAHSHANVGHVTYTTPVVRNEDKTDDFILSQISRRF